MSTGSWSITIIDTGERIIGECGTIRVVRNYNPEGGQNLQYAERDEAVGEVFACLADMFDKAE